MGEVTREEFDALEARVAALEPPVTPDPPATGTVTWKTGAWTRHSTDQEAAWEKMLNRKMQVGAVHVTHGGSTSVAQLENPWALKATKAPEVSIAIPMALSAGLGQDLSSSMKKWAQHMKADGRLFYIRLGWEMNLHNYSKVTDANLAQWRSRWSQYYDIFKSALGDKGLVGFNPNDGANQSGLSGSIMRAWVVGKVDWCGPDSYDWYPPFTSDAQVNEHLTKDQGLNWWANIAEKMGVPLALPEWGGVSGSAGAGKNGGDNPRYVQEIFTFLKKNEKNVLLENYFNESAAYLKSDLLIPQLPLARQKYVSLWGVK